MADTQEAAHKHGDRIVVKGGVILTMDPSIGDLLDGDVLIEAGEIVAVGPGLDGTGATAIDATGMIVIPGLVDGHRHAWQAMFRLALPDADGVEYSEFATRLIPAIQPQDVYAATLLSAAAAIDGGVTCLTDISHISKSAEYTDAGIRAHVDSGIRSAYVYAYPRRLSAPQFPHDIHRIKDEFFAHADGLVSLRLAADWHPEYFELARSVGVGITNDGLYGHATPHRPHTANADVLRFAAAGLLGPDVTLIHGTGFPAEVMAAIRDHDVNLVLATTSDGTLRGLGDSVSPVQAAIDFDLLDRTGLSVDVEVSLSADLFAQMRATFLLQRVQANRRWAHGDSNAPEPMSVRDVLKMATVGGTAAAGLSDRAGSLSPGKRADIVLIRANDLSTGPLNNAYGTVVTGATPANVDTVIIDGVVRKRHGRLVGLDTAAILDAATQSRNRLAREAGLWTPDAVLGARPAEWVR